MPLTGVAPSTTEAATTEPALWPPWKINFGLFGEGVDDKDEAGAATLAADAPCVGGGGATDEGFPDEPNVLP